MFSFLVASLFGNLAAILLPLVEGKLLIGLSNFLGHVHLAAFAFDWVVAFIRLAALRVYLSLGKRGHRLLCPLFMMEISLQVIRALPLILKRDLLPRQLREAILLQTGLRILVLVRLERLNPSTRFVFLQAELLVL